MKCRKPGVLLVNKPEGPSSAAIVGQVKRQLNLAKLGHAGTLDPPASGLLILLANGATRLADRAGSGMKEYRGRFRFGITTDTDDVSGTILSESDDCPSLAEVEALLPSFHGVIEQTPPQISAVKVDGKRAYKLAREGKEVVLKTRSVTVERFSVTRDDQGVWHYHIRCGKGTYVRSLIRDLGAHVSCGAAVASLERCCSEPFSLDQAVSPDELTLDAMLSWDVLLGEVPSLEVNRVQAEALLGGDTRVLGPLTESLAADVDRVVYRHESTPLGVLSRASDRWKFELNIGKLEYEEGE